jgi:cobalt-zinc-cadmium efflux system membrane fusion protein
MNFIKSNTLSMRAFPGALLVVFIALAGCGKKDATPAAAAATTAAKAAPEGSQPLALSAEESRAANLQVATVAPAASAATLTVNATIKPDQDHYAKILARAEGQVVRAPAALGDTVQAGQVLANLDSTAVGDAQLTLRQAAASQKVAAADHDRIAKLAADEIVPRKELLRAQGELDKANAELGTARERLRLLGGASSTGPQLTVRAPIAGEIIQKSANVGELVTASSPLFTVADLSRVWIDAALSEDQLTRIRAGASADITVPAYPNQVFTGRVVTVANALDPETRTALARIVIDNPKRLLKLEMFATARIATGEASDPRITVPDDAVVLLQGQPTVFLAAKSGFEPRAVQTGGHTNGRTVLTSGVVAGDKVVVAGAYALKARLLKSQIGEE